MYLVAENPLADSEGGTHCPVFWIPYLLTVPSVKSLNDLCIYYVCTTIFKNLDLPVKL